MSGQRILIVDDSLTIRKLAERVLVRAGFRTEPAETMGSALKKVPTFKPDLILLDYILPDGHGTDVCRILLKKPETASIPILLISAKGADIRKLYLDLPNVVDFVTKPFTPAVLTSVVSHVLSSRRIRQEVAQRKRDKAGNFHLFPSYGTMLSQFLEPAKWREIPEDIRLTLNGARITSAVPWDDLLFFSSSELVSFEDLLGGCEREAVSGRVEISDQDGLASVLWLRDGRGIGVLPRRTYFESEKVSALLAGIPAATLRKAAGAQEAGRASAVITLLREKHIDLEKAEKLFPA